MLYCRDCQKTFGIDKPAEFILTRTSVLTGGLIERPLCEDHMMDRDYDTGWIHWTVEEYPDATLDYCAKCGSLYAVHDGDGGCP